MNSQNKQKPGRPDYPVPKTQIRLRTWIAASFPSSFKLSSFVREQSSCSHNLRRVYWKTHTHTPTLTLIDRRLDILQSIKSDALVGCSSYLAPFFPSFFHLNISFFKKIKRI